jgi:RNA-directed DNA polymerase
MVLLHRMKNPKSKHSLRTISDLVRHLGVSEGHLSELLDELRYDETRLYRSWKEPKRSGGTRPIDAPKEELKFIQKRINKRILQPTRIHKAAFGGVRGKRLRDNLQLHTGKPMVANFDLEQFFSNIRSGQVYTTFRAIGTAPDVARILTRLTTFKGRLPQGPPTSPMLANLVAGYGGHSCLDGRIEGLCKKHRSRNGRWIDDITISGPKYLKKLEPTVERIIEQSGFKQNRDIDKRSFLSNKESQVVTRHLVNLKPNIRKEERRELRAMLYNSRTKGAELHDKARIRGKIAHIQSVNPELGAKFLVDFNSIQWPDK